MAHRCSSPGCNKSFGQKFNLTRHEKSHTRNFECTVCAQSFNRADNLKRHEKTHVDQFPCTICKRKFTSDEVRKAHEEEHMQRMTCKFCSKMFSRSGNRLAHERICGKQRGGVTLRKRTVVSRIASESFWISKVSSAFANANCKWKLRYFPNDGSNFIELLK